MSWFQNAVFYHIYPLGLLGCEQYNDYTIKEHRLRKLDVWIDHIADLGFTALYIGPLFESVGHGYETSDYRKLDSRLGWFPIATLRALKSFWTLFSITAAEISLLLKISVKEGKTARI